MFKFREIHPFILSALILICGCSGPKNQVVVYTSLDQVYSEPILKDFELQTGIKVKTVYDVEATKTTGLVNRLLAETSRPQADVFWNSEVARTILLKNKGVLQPYFSPSASGIPSKFKDKEGFWAGFAARSRVLIYNKNLLKETDLPKSIFELTDQKWNGKFAMAYPLFGTTSTHAAAIFAELGYEQALVFFGQLKANGCLIVDGNSTAKDRVEAGEIPLAFTDSDDAEVSINSGKPTGIIYPDQEAGEIGTLFIPNTVCLIKNAPHPDNGRKLIDYLLSEEVEGKLAFMDGRQIPLRDGVKRPLTTPTYSEIKTMGVSFEEIALKIERASSVLKEIFIR
ncbi:MAG: extracellular solute-binding protein [Candidatus Omnitrophica bacterium]|nr:extracellular solute-binding protein [Candidatus Omnitrophota bacterium]